MDAFIRAFRKQGTPCTNEPARTRPACKATPGPIETPDVTGFHTGKEIPNYRELARRYVLQDRTSVRWTRGRCRRTFLVSGWSAFSSDPADPMTCKADIAAPALWTEYVLDEGMDAPAPCAWASFGDPPLAFDWSLDPIKWRHLDRTPSRSSG